VPANTTLPPPACTLELARPDPASLELRLGGAWVVGARLPSAEAVTARLDESPGRPRRLRFDCHGLDRWDSRFLAFLLRIIEQAEARGLAIDRSGLPLGVQGMLELARAVPERQDIQRPAEPTGFLADLGRHTLNGLADARNFLEFTGETVVAFGRLLTGRARFQGSDLWHLIADAGPNALPIIGLLSVLVGMILAFIGAVQLRTFGAQIFIADLVGLGMSREMGAMMTAIFMAGRTGAAYAAQLGTMQVNAEIDALKTSGFPPMEFLVLPRILALLLTMPMLCLFADVLGMLGGALVSAGLFDISFPEYLSQVRNRIDFEDFGVGLFKCAVFAVLVAVAGCMRGLQCQRSSAGVGLATTSAVVTGIVFIIVADAVLTLLITTLNL
jgi:phospholipid/cholesterol/gamma-HCH transport system permease protein